MSIRVIAAMAALALVSSAAGIQAAPVSYVINFTGGGGIIQSIGPGSFSYDSMDMTNTTVGPPVTLTDYMVPATISAVITPGIHVTFTQTSPADDQVKLDSNGFATAVSVDSFAEVGTLQLNLDNTWEFGVLFTPETKQPSASSGTYSITVPSGVPEPATFTLLAAGLFSLTLLRRKRA